MMICHAPFKLVVWRPSMLVMSGAGDCASAALVATAMKHANIQRRTESPFVASACAAHLRLMTGGHDTTKSTGSAGGDLTGVAGTVSGRPEIRAHLRRRGVVY